MLLVLWRKLGTDVAEWATARGDLAWMVNQRVIEPISESTRLAH